MPAKNEPKTMDNPWRSGQTVSVWMATTGVPQEQPLTMDARADVCVIGAGIAGLSTAYLLAREGKSVIVLDDGPIGGGQTCRTTAHLANAIDDRNFEIERLHGEEGARLAVESHTAAINRIEKIARDEKIDCEFERLDGYLFLSPDDKAETLDRELEAAHRAGLAEVTRLARAPVTSFDTGPCLRFPAQGQFHPLKYLAGLARAIEDRGGRIHTGTHAQSIETKKGQPARVTTKNGPVVTAQHVVVATNTPVNDMFVIHTKQAPYTTYVIGARVPHGSVHKALYWDTHDPYHYVRLETVNAHGKAGSADARHDVLIVGGEDHKTGQADDMEDRHKRLEKWTRERFPMVEDIEFRWSGQVMEPIDGVAFIGHNPADAPNVYVATGDSGMGITHGTIAGILITDLVMGRENPWQKLYDPTRKSLGSLWEFAKENLNVALQYADWVKPGDVSKLDDIPAGTGAIVREGLKMLAVYRDADGAYHKRSATCVHLGCVVAWNPVENTWDCPCHGSRFDKFGKVIVGPANRDLEPVDE